MVSSPVSMPGFLTFKPLQELHLHPFIAKTSRVDSEAERGEERHIENVGILRLHYDSDSSRIGLIWGGGFLQEVNEEIPLCTVLVARVRMVLRDERASSPVLFDDSIRELLGQVIHEDLEQQRCRRSRSGALLHLIAANWNGNGPIVFCFVFFREQALLLLLRSRRRRRKKTGIRIGREDVEQGRCCGLTRRRRRRAGVEEDEDDGGTVQREGNGDAHDQARVHHGWIG